MWWIRHKEAGKILNVVDKPYRGRVLSLMWWGIILDIVDTTYRVGVLRRCDGVL